MLHRRPFIFAYGMAVFCSASVGLGQSRTSPPASQAESVAISEADCVWQKLGSTISVSSIGEPVSSVRLSVPLWKPATARQPAYCVIEGSMMPIDTGSSARPINFRVVLPASWSDRAAQLGGGVLDGLVAELVGYPGPTSVSLLQRGYVLYGSDSGHQGGSSLTPPPPAVLEVARARGFQLPTNSLDWTLNDEAIANFGYMAPKKTHDAAIVLIQRAYGRRPRFNYFFGHSQGGREALMAIQRYPQDYDGAFADVPALGLSSLVLAPALMRIREKPIANWVTPAKISTILDEFLRRCDQLDGLADGMINNYMACRAIFDVRQGEPNRHPWTDKRCLGNVDPDPFDTSAAACLTDGQIATLEMFFSRYWFATPLANGVTTFGMWLPNTDLAARGRASGNGLIVDARYRGQEGATEVAPVYSSDLGVAVVGFLMKDLSANPLNYVEGGAWNGRRVRLSGILDATNPNLQPFFQHGGKLIVTTGINDTTVSPGEELDYFQSVIAKIGAEGVDASARFFVQPRSGHGVNGFDHIAMLMDWVENHKAPAKSIALDTREGSLPMCTYPAYPKYTGPPESATSYSCALR
jgi:pimeloyl-ACP methyl ester carboxylesterase